MGPILGIAIRNLLLARRRTLLLGIAVALVAALFFTLRAVSSSLSERMIESATTLSAGHINVGGFFKARRKSSAPILADRARLKQIVRDKVPEAITVIDRHRGWGRLISPASSLNAGISGIVLEEESRFFDSLRLAPEREYKTDGTDKLYGDFNDLKNPNTVLIFAAQAKKLGVQVGDTITMVTEANGGQSNTVDLRVVAIASDIGFMSNWNIFVRRETVLDLYKVAQDTTGVIMVYLPSPDQAESLMARLHQDLAASGFAVMDHDPRPFFTKFAKVAGEDWLGQKLDLTVWSDEISYVLWISRALDLVSIFMVAILAIIIIGGVSNAMAMSVRERVREIGTMRAIGASRPFVAGVFLWEAIFLGLLGAMTGVLIAAVSLTLVNLLAIKITSNGVRLFLMTNTIKFNINWIDGCITLVIFAAITGLAAIWPALKAARLRPVEALNTSK